MRTALLPQRGPQYWVMAKGSPGQAVTMTNPASKQDLVPTEPSPDLTKDLERHSQKEVLNQ